MTSHAHSVHRLLKSVPASAFRAPADVVKIPADASFIDALRTLHESKVTGAPVFADEITSVPDMTIPVTVHAMKYFGFVDVADLVVSILSDGLKRPKPTGFLAKLGNLFTDDEGHHVDHAINRSGRDAFFAISVDSNAAQAAHIMATKSVHRVAIAKEQADGLHIEGIVTQSNILRLLRDNIRELGTLGSSQLGSLFAMDGHPFTMPASSSLRQCFEQLATHRFNGCALVDSDGVIIGNVSMSDVRRLSDVVVAGGDVNEVLDGSVTAFLGVDGVLRAPVTVTPRDTLSSLIELFTVAHVHRVHVVNHGRHPIGVVTMMDVIRLLLSSEVTLHSYEGDSTVAAAAASAAGSAPASVKCPLVGSHFRALEAVDFVGTDGVRLDAMVEISADASITDAMKVMEDHHLSSLPVTREEVVSWGGVTAGVLGSGYAAVPLTQKKYAGWLDAGDIAAVVLARNLTQQKTAGVLADVSHAVHYDGEHTAIASMNFSHQNAFWAVPLARKMDKVLRAFVSESAHRLAVVNVEDGRRVVGVITQSSIVRYLAKHMELLEPVSADVAARFFSMTSSSSSSSASVVTIPLAATARDALQTLVSHKVSGAPVVDSDGVIVANFSVSDVRLLAAVSNQVDADAALALPVLNFLRERAPKDMHSIAPSSLSPVVVQESDSVAMAIQLLAESRLHHIYIVDASRRPVGVLSLTDVIRALVWCLDP